MYSEGNNSNVVYTRGSFGGDSSRGVAWSLTPNIMLSVQGLSETCHFTTSTAVKRLTLTSIFTSRRGDKLDTPWIGITVRVTVMGRRKSKREK